MVRAGNVSVGRDKSWEETLSNGFDKSGPRSVADGAGVVLDWPNWALTVLCSNPTAGTPVKSRLGS